MTADFINGLFELFGAFALWGNVRAIKRDRSIAGIDWRATGFFTSWGIWNLYFYGPANGLWFSWWGGLAIVVVNCYWLVLVWKCRNRWSRYR